MRLPPLRPHRAAQQVQAVLAALQVQQLRQQAVLQVRAALQVQAVQQVVQLRCKYVYGS